jgi:Tfp pilus assembly protein PilN
LPAELRDAVKRIRIFGPRDLAQQLADELTLRFEAMGFTIEVVSAYAPNEFGVPLPVEASLSPAFSLAARRLVEQAPTFEFLPPKPTILQQISAKYSSGRLRTVGTAVAGVVLIVVGLFLFQQWQLMRLRSQWAKMEANVKELDNLQGKIRQYRPWFDDSFRSLSILRQLTKTFPEDGVVSAKTVEIRDGNVVTCTGNARDNAALLRTLSNLRTNDGVTDLKVETIRGAAPMQFSFDFRWNKGGGYEN